MSEPNNSPNRLTEGIGDRLAERLEALGNEGRLVEVDNLSLTCAIAALEMLGEIEVRLAAIDKRIGNYLANQVAPTSLMPDKMYDMNGNLTPAGGIGKTKGGGRRPRRAGGQK